MLERSLAAGWRKELRLSVEEAGKGGRWPYQCVGCGMERSGHKGLVQGSADEESGRLWPQWLRRRWDQGIPLLSWRSGPQISAAGQVYVGQLGGLWPAEGGREGAQRSARSCPSSVHRQKLHEADLELQRKREYIEELEPPADSGSEWGAAAGWGGRAPSLVGS